MRIEATFSELESRMEVDFGEVQKCTELVGGELYDGACTVLPKVEDQVLQTQNKIMPDNVTVKAVPYAEVSNQAGGVTVTIA